MNKSDQVGRDWVRIARFGGGAVMLAGLLAGCAAGPVTAPRSATQPASADTTATVQIDPSVGGVACTVLLERVRPDGRCEVVVNLRNGGSRELRVQAGCEFRDLDGLSMGDDTPWQSIALPAGATETVRFTARETRARRYTIRVWPAR